jgi:hypothetical protein
VKIRRSNKALPICVQVKFMKEYFPFLKVVYKSFNKVVWEGRMRPDLEMDEHLVRVEYILGRHPKVYVPTWNKKFKHRFKDLSLCLYFKNRKNWRPMDLIAKTIIPWSSQWLMFNEFYNITGKFGALEIEH